MYRKRTIEKIIGDAKSAYKQGVQIDVHDDIAEIESLRQHKNWIQFNDVICVYVDMKGSTTINAHQESDTAANIYEYFIATSVRILYHFNAQYVDTAGDGVFGLFRKDDLIKALRATLGMREFAQDSHCTTSDEEVDLACHIGVDISDVIVKKIGIKTNTSWRRKQTEVWAGNAVNVAAKLAALGEKNDITISPRILHRLSSEEICPEPICSTCSHLSDMKTWQLIQTNPEKLSFSKAYKFRILDK